MVRREGKYWRVQIQRGGVKHSSTFPTRAEAEAYQSKIIEDYKHRRTGTPVEYTVGQAFKRWMEEELPTLKSKRFTANHARQLLPFIDVDFPLSGIGKVWDDYKKFALAPKKKPEMMRNGQVRRQGPLAHGTINRKGAIIRRIANLAYKNWKWLHTPVHIELLPEPKQKRTSYITKAELNELLDAFDCQYARALVKMLFYTGMRVGELLNVTVERGYFVITKSKNSKARYIKIHRDIEQEAMMLPFPYKYKYFQVRFIEARNKIGRPDLKIHDLRHSFASHLLHSGEGIKTVSDLLGHSSIAITADIYSHLYRPDLDSAIDRI